MVNFKEGLSEKEKRFAKRILILIKKYKDAPKSLPNVKDELDYNIWLIMKKEIKIEDFGLY